MRMIKLATMQCWAKELSQCSDAQSEEHIVSENLFPSGWVIVEGFAWCKAPKRIPARKLASNILCTRHNHERSPVDAEGGRLMQVLRGFGQLNQRQHEQNCGATDLVEYTFDKALLERWFLKTTINLVNVLSGDFVWQQSQTPPLEPPLVLLQAAFGQVRLSRPFGLFVAMHEGDVLTFHDQVTAQPFLQGRGVVGVEFR